MILKEAYIEIQERKYAQEIAKEQQRLHSGEISEDEYEKRYEAIMDDRRIRILSLLPP